MKNWVNREVRIEARRYAAALMDLQQDAPEWWIDAGIPEEKLPIFLNELERIADRLHKSAEG